MHSLSLLPPLLSSLLPGRPLLCRPAAAETGCVTSVKARAAPWLKQEKKNGEKIARWVRGTFLSFFNPHLPITIVSVRVCVIASLTLLLLLQNATHFMQHPVLLLLLLWKQEEIGCMPSCRPFPPRGHSCCTSVSVCVNLTPGLFVHVSHYIYIRWRSSLQWCHLVMPLVHTHMILCVIDPCALQIYEEQWMCRLFTDREPETLTGLFWPGSGCTCYCCPLEILKYVAKILQVKCVSLCSAYTALKLLVSVCVWMRHHFHKQHFFCIKYMNILSSCSHVHRLNANS